MHHPNTLVQQYDTDIDLSMVLVFPHEQNVGPFEDLCLVFLKM